MPRLSIILSFVLVYGILLSTPVEVGAHKVRTVRKAMVTVRAVGGAQSMAAMLWMRLGGHRAKKFLAKYDLNRSGTIEGRESLMLGDALSPEAIGGFYLALDDKPLVPIEAKAKAKSESDAIEIAVLITYPMVTREDFTLTLGNRKWKGAEKLGPLISEISVLPPLEVRSPNRPRSGVVVGPVKVIAGGDGLSVRIGQKTQQPITQP